MLLSGFVVGFEVADQEEAWKIVDGVELFSRTANLGDVRSTITHPWTTTHGRMQPEEKLAANHPPGLDTPLCWFGTHRRFD